jgi:ribosomal-protein-alanine N-acetyltransferase
MEQFEIVPMREESLPEVLEIAEAAKLAHWSYSDYKAEIALANSLTIQINDNYEKRVAGFMVMRLITNRDVLEYTQADIMNIAISEKYRKQGLGSKLIRTGIAIAKGHSPSLIWLEVRRSNSPAISFYKKHGFAEEYERKNFYSDPLEDAIIMKMEI